MRCTIGILAALLVGMLADGAAACTCAAGLTPVEYFAHAQAVFCGRVVGVSDVDRETREFTFAVGASWKGVDADTVIVRSFKEGATCGVNFSTGANMLVYAHRQADRLWTGTCSGNSPFESALFDRYLLGGATIHDPQFSLAPVSIDDLFRALTSQDDAQCRSAAAALGGLKNEMPAIKPRLQELLSQGTLAEQKTAAWAIGRMGDGAMDLVPSLEGSIQSPSMDVRVASYEAIFSIVGRRAYFTYLLRELRDPAKEVQAHACEIARGDPSLSVEQQQALLAELDRVIDKSAALARGYAIRALRACGCLAVDLLPKLDLLAEHDDDDWPRGCAKSAAAEIRKECGDKR